MSTYINTLPKELRTELQYYVNYPYWSTFNQLLKWNRIQSFTSDELSVQLKQRCSHYFNELDIKYVEVLKGSWWSLYEIYYQIPHTEVVTVDTLVKYINTVLNYRYAPHLADIGNLNVMLKELNCEEQIVAYSLGTETKYVAVKL